MYCIVCNKWPRGVHFLKKGAFITDEFQVKKSGYFGKNYGFLVKNSFSMVQSCIPDDLSWKEQRKHQIVGKKGGIFGERGEGA